MISCEIDRFPTKLRLNKVKSSDGISQQLYKSQDNRNTDSNICLATIISDCDKTSQDINKVQIMAQKLSPRTIKKSSRVVSAKKSWLSVDKEERRQFLSDYKKFIMTRAHLDRRKRQESLKNSPREQLTITKKTISRNPKLPIAQE